MVWLLLNFVKFVQLVLNLFWFYFLTVKYFVTPPCLGNVLYKYILLTDVVWNLIKNKVYPLFLMLASEERQCKDCLFPQLGTAQHLVFYLISA